MDNAVFSFFSHPWAFWIALALVAGITEVLIAPFGFIFASLAALIAALVSPWFGWAVQIAVFGVTLLSTVFLLRPHFLAKVNTVSRLLDRAEMLCGKSGQVTESIDSSLGTGRVLVEGQDWAARSTQALPVGQKITVTGSDGITLIVSTLS